MEEPFEMDPIDDGLGAEQPHTEGNRELINEVGDEEAETFFRERVGPPEDHGDGEHINVNLSVENDATGASMEIDNIHDDI